MSQVAVIKCSSYEKDDINTAVKSGIELVNATVKSGEKILLKPNLLANATPEEGVTTHPEIFRAVAEYLNEKGAQLSYGDSPAMQSPEKASKKAQIYTHAEKLKIPLADFELGEDIESKDNTAIRKFHIARGALAADSIVSIAKMKTHGFTTITGAIKNQLGLIPGFRKAEFHSRLPNPVDFAKMLVGLNLTIRNQLYIMDGIVAMEGNGPRNGKTRSMNVLMFSKDPVALDYTMAIMMGADTEKIPCLEWGVKMGLGHIENIEYIGENPANFVRKDFIIPPVRAYNEKSLIIRTTRQMVIPRPVIIKNKCVKCGKCVEICPVNPKAVQFKKNTNSKYPQYDYNRCIRCYCCQEICPEGAIDIKVPFLGKILKLN